MCKNPLSTCNVKKANKNFQMDILIVSKLFGYTTFTLNTWWFISGVALRMHHAWTDRF